MGQINKKKPAEILPTKLKRGDQVTVIAGKFKGTAGPIIKFNPKKNQVFVEGILTKKHQKPTQQEQEGGIVDVPRGIHISNVMLNDGKAKEKKLTKVGFKMVEDKKSVSLVDQEQN